MGFLTHEQKTKILRLKSNGKGPSEIVRILAEDDMEISRWSIIRFLRRFQERKSLDNAAKSGRPPLGVTMELLNFIDAEMESNDELTSPELKRILLCFGVQFSSQKVRRLRWKLGWVPTGTKYLRRVYLQHREVLEREGRRGEVLNIHSAPAKGLASYVVERQGKASGH